MHILNYLEPPSLPWVSLPPPPSLPPLNFGPSPSPEFCLWGAATGWCSEQHRVGGRGVRLHRGRAHPRPGRRTRFYTLHPTPSSLKPDLLLPIFPPERCYKWSKKSMSTFASPACPPAAWTSDAVCAQPSSVKYAKWPFVRERGNRGTSRIRKYPLPRTSRGH